jgi:putative DNA methylase
VVGRCADYGSSGVVWAQEGEFVAHTFGRQALPLVWDFAEAVPWRDASGNFDGAVEWVCRVIDAWPGSSGGQSQIADATNHPLPDDTAKVWFTDPPYYDAVPYADLSDFFLIWLKRALLNHSRLRDPFDPKNNLTPKTREVVQDETKRDDGRPKDRSWFEERMSIAFTEGRRLLADNGIGCVVFAHKSTEGWEALLSGLVRGGWTITSSWPIATERPGRLRSQDSAALATSIHLICRPRSQGTTGDWQQIFRNLPKRVGDWMERLQTEGVRGADLVFASIGPALELYSRFDKVVDAEEREIPLGGNPEAREAHERGYLAYVWEVVGRTALEQVLGTAEARARNGAAGALEEDARLTALFLWTLQSTNGIGTGANNETEAETEDINVDEDDDEPKSKKKKGFTLIYDVARRFAQPLGIHLEDWEDRIIETKKGIVRLLPVSERAKQLFGEEGMQTIASELERGSKDSLQMSLYADLKERETPKVRGRRSKTRVSTEGADRGMQTRWEPTTLDRIHAAMLLQASGRAKCAARTTRSRTRTRPRLSSSRECSLGPLSERC